MSFKSIIITMGLLLILNGCERGVGKEPITVENVKDNNLTGTWVLSETYTDKRVIKRLDKNIEEYFFTIFLNKNLNYHSFDSVIGFSKPEFYDGKGKWEFFGKNILLKKFRKGVRFNGNLYEFRITKKNNKLLLWYYDGDYDARRYVMYEKKSK